MNNTNTTTNNKQTIVSATPRNNCYFSISIFHITNKVNLCTLYQLDRPFPGTGIVLKIESLSITYTANGKRQIQVEKFLKIEKNDKISSRQFS